MAKQKPTKIKKQNNILWLSWVSYFTDFSSEMLMPILPIFFTETLGISKGLLGIIEGVAESFSSLIKVFSGYLSDKLKKRKIFILIGYGLPAVLKPMFIFATQWWHLFILRFLERSGKGFRDPPRDALIASSARKHELGGVFGFQRMMDTMGAVTGVVALTIILHYIPGNYIPLFLIAFIPGIIAVLIAAFKVRDDKHIEKSEKKINFKAVLNLPKRYKFFLIPTFVFAIGNMSYAFFILRAQNIGLPVVFLPMIYLIYTIIYAAISIPAGQLSDKIGHIPALIIGNLFFLASCILFMFNIPIEFTVIVFVLYGLFFAFNVGIAKAYVSHTVPIEYNATANGIYNFIVGICALPASAVVGYLWDTFNATTAFGYSAVLTFVSTFLYLFLLKKPKKQTILERLMGLVSLLRVKRN